MYETYELNDDAEEDNVYSANDLRNINQDGDIIRVNNTLVFNPFNVHNKEITLNDVQSILRDYGIRYNVNNIELYKRAFVHSSYVKRTFDVTIAKKITSIQCPRGCVDLKTKSNERLEFIGDGVLELITKYYLYRRFPKASEGFMTEKKISVFEAFIGAIFLDFNNVRIIDEDYWFRDIFTTGPGFQMAQIFVENVFEKHIDWTNLISNDDNYKNILQVKVQKEFKTTPIYIELSYNPETGYDMGVFIGVGKQPHEFKLEISKPFAFYGSISKIHEELRTNGSVFVFMSNTEHKIKKKAEQFACEIALKLF